MDTKIVTINLGARSYDIYIGAGLLYRFADFMPAEIAGRSIFIVTDKSVEHYAQTVKDNLLENGAAKAVILSLFPGERAKSFNHVQQVCSWLLDNGVDRDSMIIAVGGGVVGDLTGFCASIIMRGVPYIQVPTTLLAQVDSSVGGKTGIDVQQGKNLVGSFYQPAAVIADMDTLKTLPRRQLLAGYAEIVKYGLINDSVFFEWLEENGKAVCDVDTDAISHVVEHSTQAKAKIVEADENERGARALLNLGHTFGHTLETAAGYGDRLYHGEAVAIGTVMAFDLSVRMGICDREDLECVEKHFEEIGLPTRASFIHPRLDISVDELMQIMGRDKKAARGMLKFVLVNGIGEAFIADDVPEKLVRAVVRDSLGSEGRKSMRGKFKSQGVKGLWTSVFSSLS